MKIIIASALNIVAVAGGVVGGALIKPGDAMSSNSQAEEDYTADTQKGSKDDHGEDQDHKAQKGKDGKDKLADISTDYYPLKFSRPFVVPVADGWRTQSLVVITMNVELHNNVEMDTPGLEEKLRDRIMTALVTFSHEGGFDGAMSNPALYDQVRSTTRTALENVYPEMVGNVLISEMLRRAV